MPLGYTDVKDCVSSLRKELTNSGAFRNELSPEGFCRTLPHSLRSAPPQSWGEGEFFDFVKKIATYSQTRLSVTENYVWKRQSLAGLIVTFFAIILDKKTLDANCLNNCGQRDRCRSAKFNLCFHARIAALVRQLGANDDKDHFITYVSQATVSQGAFGELCSRQFDRAKDREISKWAKVRSNRLRPWKLGAWVSLVAICFFLYLHLFS